MYSSLIVCGFPNCVAVLRSMLKQIIHVRERFSASRACLSVCVLLVAGGMCRFRSIATLHSSVKIEIDSRREGERKRTGSQAR
jgi:hypothetical protein